MDKIKVTFLKDRRCVIDIDSPYFMTLRNHFSYDNPAARFTKYSRLPKRLYSITMNGYCDIGLLWNIMKFIKSEGWDAKLDMTDRVKSILSKEIDCEIVEVPNKKYKLRDYQLDSVKNGLSNGGGLCLVGTGGGKSLIIATLLETLYKNDGESFKAMLVVPNLSLSGSFTEVRILVGLFTSQSNKLHHWKKDSLALAFFHCARRYIFTTLNPNFRL